MTAPPLTISPVDPTDPPVAGLVRLHMLDMRSITPPGHALAVGPTTLDTDDDATLLGAWSGEQLAGLGALRELSPTHGEIKSVRTDPDHTRMGVAQAVLGALLDLARKRGYTRVSLETGASEEFDAAARSYEAAGFTPTGPFGDHVDTEHHRYFTLAL